MISAYVFVDADYVRIALQRLDVDWENTSLSTVAGVALRAVGSKWRGDLFSGDRIFIYGAVGDDEAGEKVKRWLERNDLQIDTHVRLGRVVGSPPRQKGVDVRFAVEAYRFATKRIMQAAILIAGDGDYVPLASALHEEGILVAVCGFRESVSVDLMRIADRVGYLPGDAQSWAGWTLPS